MDENQNNPQTSPAQVETPPPAAPASPASQPPSTQAAQPPAQTPTQPSSQQTNNVVYGGFILRWAAWIIDVVILSIPFALIGAILGNETIRGLGAFAYILVYAPIGTGKYGTTLGKKLFNLQVVPADNNPMTIGRGYLRDLLGKIVAMLPADLGFIWAAFDGKKQGWHDKIAKTYVVQTAPIGKGKKFLVYAIAFFFPGLIIIGLFLTIILSAIDPVEQFRRAEEAKQLQLQNEQSQQQLAGQPQAKFKTFRDQGFSFEAPAEWSEKQELSYPWWQSYFVSKHPLLLAFDKKSFLGYLAVRIGVGITAYKIDLPEAISNGALTEEAIDNPDPAKNFANIKVNALKLAEGPATTVKKEYEKTMPNGTSYIVTEISTGSQELGFWELIVVTRYDGRYIYQITYQAPQEEFFTYKPIFEQSIETLETF